MELVTILNKANRAYADGFLADYYDENTGLAKNGNGDSLAKFIVAEIRETYNEASADHDQIMVARRAIANGARDLEAVVNALDELLR